MRRFREPIWRGPGAGRAGELHRTKAPARSEKGLGRYFFWSWMSDLNRRPHDYESGALPTELIQRDTADLGIIPRRFRLSMAKRRFSAKVKITICNHNCKTSENAEIPGNGSGKGENHGKILRRKRAEILLNAGENLLNQREKRPVPRENNGLRNTKSEKAIQQVIHIVHIVIHNSKTALFGHLTSISEEKKKKFRTKMKFCEIHSFT